jgi:hypothetical protein
VNLRIGSSGNVLEIIQDYPLLVKLMAFNIMKENREGEVLTY